MTTDLSRFLVGRLHTQLTIFHPLWCSPRTCLSTDDVNERRLGNGAYAMQKRVLYSEANYAAIVRDRGYFVDKTAYITKLEQIRNPVFLRPRRFGKSVFCSLLRYYYGRLLQKTSDQRRKEQGRAGTAWQEPVLPL